MKSENQSYMQTVPGSSWNVANFEEVTDELDLRDEELTVDTVDSRKLKIARPYLVVAGIENGIKFTFFFLHEALYVFTFG